MACVAMDIFADLLIGGVAAVIVVNNQKLQRQREFYGHYHRLSWVACIASLLWYDPPPVYVRYST